MNYFEFVLLFSVISSILSSAFIMSSKCHKLDKSKQTESISRSENLFVPENALFKHSIISNRHVISSRCVVLADFFDHLNLASILKTSFLDYFVTIKE